MSGYVGPFKKYAPPEEFWSWFAASAPRTFPPPPESLDAIMGQLLRVHDGLAFQVGTTDSGLVLEISADGNPTLISVVTGMCAVAPAIPGWTVRAFRQASAAVTLRIGPHTYSKTSVEFSIERDGADTYIALFLDGFDTNREQIGQAGYMLLEATLGELVLMTEVKTVAMFDREERWDDARPLTELPAALDN